MFTIYAKDLEPSQIAAISGIKDWVNSSIEVRDRRAKLSPEVEPSAYWQAYIHLFDYMNSMPPEQFKALRLHTYHVDGDTYSNTKGSYPEDYGRFYAAVRSGLPERYCISAPHLCGEYGQLIDGHLINDKVNKWQSVIRNLWYNGELTRLENIDRPVILEIGAGYGGLAHHFMTMFPKAAYVIVDLPETLLYSASYLTLIHGPERVGLVEQDSPISLDSLEGSRFVLTPNFLLSALSDLRFDLAINMDSFQEMTEAQVTQYLEFLSSRTSVLFSKNIDCFEFSSDKVEVTPILRRYFDLRPLLSWPTNPDDRSVVERTLRSFARGMRNRLVDALYWNTRKAQPITKGGSYLAVPKSGGATDQKSEPKSTAVSHIKV